MIPVVPGDGAGKFCLGESVRTKEKFLTCRPHASGLTRCRYETVGFEGYYDAQDRLVWLRMYPRGHFPSTAQNSIVAGTSVATGAPAERLSELPSPQVVDEANDKDLGPTYMHRYDGLVVAVERLPSGQKGRIVALDVVARRGGR
jgi:hypothetical protein